MTTLEGPLLKSPPKSPMGGEEEPDFHEYLLGYMTTEEMGGIFSRYFLQRDASTPRIRTRFDLACCPDSTVTLREFAGRFHTYIKEINRIHVFYALALMEKIHLLVDSFNEHKFFAISFVLAHKILHDNIHTEKYYAHVAGILLPEFVELEYDFLELVEWNTNVKPEEIVDVFLKLSTPLRRFHL